MNCYMEQLESPTHDIQMIKRSLSIPKTIKNNFTNKDKARKTLLALCGPVQLMSELQVISLL